MSMSETGIVTITREQIRADRAAIEAANRMEIASGHGLAAYARLEMEMEMSSSGRYEGHRRSFGGCTEHKNRF